LKLKFQKNKSQNPKTDPGSSKCSVLFAQSQYTSEAGALVSLLEREAIFLPKPPEAE